MRCLDTFADKLRLWIGSGASCSRGDVDNSSGHERPKDIDPNDCGPPSGDVRRAPSGAVTCHAPSANLSKNRESVAGHYEDQAPSIRSIHDAGIILTPRKLRVYLPRKQSSSMFRVLLRRSLYPRKRPFAALPQNDAKGHKRTHAVQQILRYSITSSAVASSESGTARPSALVDLRLITSSNVVGACTGRSLGFSPLRTRFLVAAVYFRPCCPQRGKGRSHSRVQRQGRKMGHDCLANHSIRGVRVMHG